VPSQTPITIIVPAHNELQYCRACIESLRANTGRSCHLVLVNNGSTDGVGEYFDAVPGATAIHSAENVGFAGGVNLGLAIAEGHVVLLNSDTLVPPGWLSRLEAALLSAKRWGAVGPTTNCASGEQQLPDAAGLEPHAFHPFASQRWQDFENQVREVSRLAGFCMMLRDGVWQEIGHFDTRFGIGNYEDDDYCTRIRHAGHALGIALGCFVYHFGGRTFTGMGLEGPAYNALLEENRRKYMDKWDVFVPSAAGLSRSRAAALTRDGADALARGDAATALRRYREAIAMDPANPAHYFGLGAILAQMGHSQLAAEAYTSGLKHAPEDPIALRKLADLRPPE
jgi:GT2 family glycosyltransferase